MTNVVLAAVAGCLATLAFAALFPPPPPAVPANGAVVRVLDIVIRDSNTTNRRQRFECRPTKRESKR